MKTVAHARSNGPINTHLCTRIIVQRESCYGLTSYSSSGSSSGLSSLRCSTYYMARCLYIARCYTRSCTYNPAWEKRESQLEQELTGSVLIGFIKLYILYKKYGGQIFVCFSVNYYNKSKHLTPFNYHCSTLLYYTFN